jgi:hypothetical protein
MAYETKAQSAVYMVLTLIFAIGAFYTIGANIHALIVCAPQAGKWMPWTGTICYGEKE